MERGGLAVGTDAASDWLHRDAWRHAQQLPVTAQERTPTLPILTRTHKDDPTPPPEMSVPASGPAKASATTGRLCPSSTGNSAPWAPPARLTSYTAPLTAPAYAAWPPGSSARLCRGLGRAWRASTGRSPTRLATTRARSRPTLTRMASQASSASAVTPSVWLAQDCQGSGAAPGAAAGSAAAATSQADTTPSPPAEQSSAASALQHSAATAL